VMPAAMLPLPPPQLAALESAKAFVVAGNKSAFKQEA